MMDVKTLGQLACCAALLHCSPNEPSPSQADPSEAVTEQGRHGLTSEQASKRLFSVGETVVTVGDFADRLHALSPYLRARYVSTERRREFLENMIRFELLAQEARARGLADSDEVERARKDAMVERMMEKLFDEETIKPSAITEAEIAAFYEQHREEFRADAQVRATHVLVASAFAAQSIIERAQALETTEDPLLTLAQQQTADEKPRIVPRDLRFFSRNAGDDEREVPQPVRDAAFSLKETGEIFPTPVKSKLGYHVVMLVARRDAYNRPLADVKPVIRNRLWREKRSEAINAFVAGLRKEAKVEEHLELLDSLSLDGASTADKEAPAP